MLDALLSHHEKDGEDSISEENVRSILWDAFQAGTKTTATITEWVMAHLAPKPQILEKLQTEIANEVGLQRLVTEGDIPRLKYLRAVVKEAFRLHPPEPLGLPHYSQEPCTVPHPGLQHRLPQLVGHGPRSWHLGAASGILPRADSGGALLQD
jgi:cytochrome P450